MAGPRQVTPAAQPKTLSASKIGVLSAVDYMFAVPLTLIVNALPLTPSGIGVGEAAFDQICRWLEPAPSGAAFRA